jgi:hypothetical protein
MCLKDGFIFQIYDMILSGHIPVGSKIAALSKSQRIHRNWGLRLSRMVIPLLPQFDYGYAGSI